ncbi:MAG: multiheme c-type cytochrome [Desulfomonilaceae bacterium]
MVRKVLRTFVTIGLSVFFASAVAAQGCLDCHEKTTPSIVSDWQVSKHRGCKIGCVECHGDQHKSAQDVAAAKIPTAETCANCHQERVKQFKSGKHAKAWTCMMANPSTHFHPKPLTLGMKGCGGCHKIGLKTEEQVKELKKNGAGFGAASCDACHTRHTFSVREAKEPKTCQTCHTGFDVAHWEMWQGSKHGIRHSLKQLAVLPPSAGAPTCQTCHMQEGNHGVRAAWGFGGLRLPLPEDKQWAADRTTILQALGVLDANGNPGPKFNGMKAIDFLRFTADDWQKERDKMVKTCNQCHSVNFVKEELAKGDEMIKAADHLMAQAILVVSGLYKDGILPKGALFPFPVLLMYHDAPTVIHQKLYMMFMEARQRSFQGTFHNNPAYAYAEGYARLFRDLTEIKELAARMREEAEKKGLRH